MGIKRRLFLALTGIILISGLTIIALVAYEVGEQIEILTDHGLSDAEKVDAMRHEAKEILIALTLFIILILIGALLSIRYVTQRLLIPFERLSEELSQRSSLNLTPIELPTPSKEMAMMVLKVNQLLQNIGQRIEYEKAFTADVAHELRTPLAGMRLTLELMEEQPETQLLINRIDDLLITIERLLQFSRASYQLHLENVAEFDLIQTVIEPLLAEYQPHFPHPLKVSVPARLMMRGDASLIYLLLKNLLDNIRFYATDGEYSEIIARAENGDILLEVKDRGPGIPREEKERLKARFHRADRSRQGFGLGLHIVEKIVLAHHGEIRFLERDDHLSGLQIRILFPQ